MIVRLNKNQKLQFTNPSHVYFLVNWFLKMQQPYDRDKEFFFVFGLKRNNFIQFMDVVSMGTLTATVVSGREVFRNPIKYASAGIILSHNHPSGNKQPSESDKILTQKLVIAGETLDIFVIDHVIVTTDCGYYSFAENDLISPK
jgi:DNA repair protein RadC